MLESINSPEDLRSLTPAELSTLADEIREFIVDAVSHTGGHLGSNLGAVELTLALHRVFESPKDQIIWDVGHQAYVHKILTGRKDQFSDLRRGGGLSGYPSREESSHDIVENSHASTSLSWAFGLASAQKLRGESNDRSVVAVIGDGSLTGGMAFEALNNLGHAETRVVIVLNDNGRSYAPTVGHLTENIAKLRLSPQYIKGRRKIGQALDHLPGGDTVKRGLSGAAAAAREMIEPPAFFEDLGVRYSGPFDGHDVETVEMALRQAKEFDGPIVVHVITQKGKGYAPAEQDDEKRLHDTGAFDPATGQVNGSQAAEPFVKSFTRALLTQAELHPEIVALTAAMPGSTGLLEFQRRWPERFFDVGIAEQHAVTAAAGLATAGMRPVVAIYSTFLTRAVDQMLFDVGLHRQPVVFCVDRAGITGPDGASHHGIFDIALCRQVPGMTIFTPSCAEDLEQSFVEAIAITSGPTTLRWPRGACLSLNELQDVEALSGRKLRAGSDICLVAWGPLVWRALEAADLLETRGISTSVWDGRVARPLPQEIVADAQQHKLVVTVEDGVREGGAGAALAMALSDARSPTPVAVLGVPVKFLPQGSPDDIHAQIGLDAKGIAAAALKTWNAKAIL
jgi:1-deoxy-D-xylulose-5-phosphate synthase